MSLQLNKINANLGREVHKHLLEIGLETPIAENADWGVEFAKVRQDAIEQLFGQIMGHLNLNLSDDSLEETPKRMAKMYMNEIFWGLNPDNFPKVTVVDNKIKYNEMVIERGITVHSTCEHHLLPILGKAYVAYIPTNAVPGLSKINRIVEYYSRRPQIQERLTMQIYHALAHILKTEDIAVVIDAEHMCVKTRGVEDACSDTSTSKLGGVFLNHAVRDEFLAHIARPLNRG